MGNIIEVKNVSVKYITGDLRNIGIKEYFMKKLTRKYQVQSTTFHLLLSMAIC